MNTVQIPITEYEKLKEELSLLKSSELLSKMNRLIDLIYEDKYGLYLHDYTDDLTEFAVNSSWQESKSEWDNV